MHQLTLVEAVHQVLAVVDILAVRLLYATPRGSVVASHRETYERTVGQGDGTLHESLTKRAATHNDTSVPILYGTGDNLRGRSRILVDEHHEASLAELTLTLGIELRARRAVAFGIYNLLARLQEVACHIHGSLQVTSSVALQVKDEVLHLLLLQCSQCIAELLVCSGAETAYLDVAYLGSNHIGSVERVYGNLVACHAEGQLLIIPTAHDTQLHYRTLGATQAFHDFVACHLYSGDSRVVHRHDAVARQYAHLL